MNNLSAQYGVVDLNNVKQNNIVYIDLGKPLQESIFEQQYKLAAQTIAEIISRSGVSSNPSQGVCSRCPRSTCDACIHRSSRGYNSQDAHQENLTNYHSAVPFIGDRGTGKTSVMYSTDSQSRREEYSV